MALLLARKEGKQGSVAFHFSSEDISLVAQLEEQYAQSDILLHIASPSRLPEDYQPVVHVTQLDLFQQSIHKLFKLTDTYAYGS